MTKKIIQSIGTTFRYSSLSDNTKPSAVSRLRLTTQKMAKNFMMTLKEGHLKLTWITHKKFSLVLVHLKMQEIRHHYFSLPSTHDF